MHCDEPAAGYDGRKLHAREDVVPWQNTTHSSGCVRGVDPACQEGACNVIELLLAVSSHNVRHERAREKEERALGKV